MTRMSSIEEESLRTPADAATQVIEDKEGILIRTVARRPHHAAVGHSRGMLMRKPTLLLAITLAAAVPSFAAQDRSHSYFTYDDGGTIVRQGDDGRETEARVNFPVFPGDEVTTSRRGRAEIRLADGNVLALDRSTSVRFRSILDSYDGDSAQTVVELRYGHAAVRRTGGTREMLRLDTQNASYAATGEAIYAVEADSSRAQDRVVVFDGAIEVRTPTRTTRLREGEQGRV